MKIEDCQPGARVQIAGRYLHSPLNSVATVVGTNPEPDPEPSVYPHGMVLVRLDEDIDWPEREVCIGPEDLATPLPTGHGSAA